MAGLLREAGGRLNIMVIGTFLVGTIFGVLGVLLVYLGSTGNTEFSLFGQSFKSSDVGISSIFISVVMIILNIRNINKTTTQLADSQGGPKKWYEK